jgi:hypothetical protein
MVEFHIKGDEKCEVNEKGKRRNSKGKMAGGSDKGSGP